MSSDDETWVGRSVGDRYTLTKQIGSGGMSTVYDATDTLLGRTVAIKLFNPGEAREDSRRRAEVDVLARLNHPNLVTMYDAQLASGDSSVPSFLVMEMVDGPDLRSTLDHGPLRGEVAAQVANDIANALAAMHAQGIVHRDLKPANILLAPTGLPSPTYRAKLADFGIAHLVGAERMTTAGTIVGTASYLSPEQAAGDEPGPAADIYALGLVILEGLTGHREFPGTVIEAMSARASRDPVVSDTLPPEWVSLLTQMTARDAAARPTADDVAARTADIAPALAAWDGDLPASHVGDETAPMTTPTRAYGFGDAASTAGAATGAGAGAGAGAETERLSAVDSGRRAEDPATVMPGSSRPVASDPMPRVTPTRQRRRGRVALVTVAVIVVLGAGAWAGGMLMTAAPSADPAPPAVVPSSSVPSGDPSASVAPVVPAEPGQGTAPDPAPSPSAPSQSPSPTASPEPTVTPTSEPSPTATPEPEPTSTAPTPSPT